MKKLFGAIFLGIGGIGSLVISANAQTYGDAVNFAKDVNSTYRVLSSFGSSSGGSSHANSVSHTVGAPIDAKIVNPMNVKYSNTPVFDGPGLKSGANFIETRLDTNISKTRDIKELIIAWMKFAIQIVLLVAVIAIVWAGILYITSFGEDGRTETARNIIKWVVVGIIIMLSAYAIVNTVMSVTG